MRRGLMAAGCFLSAVVPVTAAPPLRPYGADYATLHLWHLDEGAPPFIDSGGSPTPLFGLLNGAVAGKASLENFGSAVSFVWPGVSEPGADRPYGPILLAMPGLDTGTKDNLDGPEWHGIKPYFVENQ